MSFEDIPVWEGFQWINDRKIVELLLTALPYAGTGRRGYTKARLVQWLLYRQCHGCTYRDLESMSKIDYSTFIKCRQQIKGNGWLEYIFQTLAHTIASQRKLTLLSDSSFVEQYARKKEVGAEYWGFKEKTGFKVHQIIDFKTRMPLAKLTTGGARSDIAVAKVLVEHLPQSWNVGAFLADKGYDGAEFVQQIHSKWSRVAVGIPVRKSPQSTRKSRRQETPKNRELKEADRTLTTKLYNQRTEIERYFSRKKEVFHLGSERTRGLENFHANCTMTDLCAQLEFLATPAPRSFSPSSFSMGLTSTLP